MNSTLEKLKMVPEVLEIKEVFLTDEIKEKIGPLLVKKAEANAEKIHVYRMIYESDGYKVVGYITEPKTDENKLPCIIWNRGGSNDFGSIKIGQLFLRIGEFSLNGYITISTQYRGNAGGDGIDEFGGNEVADVIKLHSILKEHPRADIERIGMWGASRGGMMLYRCLVKVNWIKAAVAVSAVADLINQENFRPEMKDHHIKMFGGSEFEKKKRSALYWVDKFPKNVPILIMHGTADWRVDPMDSIKMSCELYENKVPHRLVMFEGNDHALSENKTEAMKFALEWFDRFVKNKDTLPNLEKHGE